jgi:hypothetical protein
MHVFIATPAYGEQVTTTYFNAFLGVLPILQRVGFSVGFAYSSLLPRARNDLVASFMQRPEATHLLFWDADIGIDAPSLQRMLDRNVAVIGAPCRRKQNEGQSLGLGDFNISLRNRDNFDDPQGHKVEVENGFLRVSRIGTGFVLIKRETFVTMQAGLPQLRYTSRGKEGFGFFDTMIHPKTGEYISEDFAFCDRWVIDCGGEIWVDAQAQVDHFGAHHYRGRLLDVLERIGPGRSV